MGIIRKCSNGISAYFTFFVNWLYYALILQFCYDYIYSISSILTWTNAYAYLEFLLIQAAHTTECFMQTVPSGILVTIFAQHVNVRESLKQFVLQLGVTNLVADSQS